MVVIETDENVAKQLGALLQVAVLLHVTSKLGGVQGDKNVLAVYKRLIILNFTHVNLCRQTHFISDSVSQ